MGLSGSLRSFRSARTLSFRFLVALSVFSALCVLVSTRQTAFASNGDDWSMFRHDPQHTGYSTSQRPNANKVLWSYATSGAVESSPAVVSGRVYVVSDDGNVYCLESSTGAKAWNFTVGAPAQHMSSPAISNGLVYVGSYSGLVYCLNASTGAEVWNFGTGDRVYSSPTVVGGRVYIGAYDGSGVYCLDASTGAKLWNCSTGGQVWSSPAVFDGRIYVGSIQDHGIHCINASNGMLLWNYTTGGAVWSSPAVADGRVYVGSNDNKTYCFDAVTGTRLWSYSTGYLVESSPAVVGGRVYVGSHDESMYCLNGSTGALIWSFATGGFVSSSPAFADDRVYVGCYDNKTYCLNADNGAHVWNVTTGNYIISSPAVASARIYVGSADGKIYCLGWTAAVSAPQFDLVKEEQVEFEGGLNVTYTFQNHNFPAAAGSVWLPEERVVCNVPLVNGSSGTPTGNLSEPVLFFDINGDGDMTDTYVVRYVDSSTAEVNGVLVHAQLPPGRRFLFNTLEGYGIYYVYDKTSFQLGSKNHTMHKIAFPTGQNIGYAEFGLDVSFRDLSGPCLQLTIEQLSSSSTGSPLGQLAAVKYNGTDLPVGSAFSASSPHSGDGQWLVDKIYTFPLGALQPGDVFTLGLSTTGEPGTYLLLVDLNWSPDSVSRYKYPNVDALTITGTVHQSIPFGNTTYPIDVFTNSTFQGNLNYSWRAKELSFNATLLGTFAYFWNVTVPQELLKGTWTVDVPASHGSFVETLNGTHAFLYFTTDASALPPDFLSGAVSINSSWGLADTFPPRVSNQQRDPAGDVAVSDPVMISVNASDVESGVSNATLYYSTNNATWSAEQMTFNDTTSMYEAVIPGQQAGSHVKYRTMVFDGAGNNVTVGSEYTIAEEVWAPSVQGAAVAAAVCVTSTAVVSTLASAAGSSVGQAGSKVGEKIQDLLPGTVKKWLADSVSSRNKVLIKEKAGSRFLLTRLEVVSYAVALSILTLGFAYAKSESPFLMFGVIPLILATGIVTDFVKSYIVTTVARHLGVWTEHRVWYLGLSLFAFSTFVFRVPFSSPSKLAHYSPKMTKRSDGLLSSFSVVLAFGFALVFLALYLTGFTLVGNIGLIMCLTGVLFDTMPIPPMGGRGIFEWNKFVWLGLFAMSIVSYGVALLMF